MTLRKVGKYYWLDIRIKGNRIRRSLYTENKLEALDRYKEKKDELIAEYDKKKIKFKDFCDQYLEWTSTSKPASYEAEDLRLKIIRNFFQEKFDIVFLDDIKPYHVEQLKAWLIKEKKARATVNRYLQLLRGLFYRAMDWEIFKGTNPLTKVKFFKENPKVKTLTDESIHKVLKAAQEISENPKSKTQALFYDIVKFAMNTGLRRSEMLNLTWRDIRYGVATVKGKGDKKREIPLNKIAMRIIQKQPEKSEYIFDLSNRNKSHIFRQTFKQMRKKTGIDFNLHLLRHYFTTKLLESGVDIRTIGSLLGHSRITISLIYTHTSLEKKIKAVNILGIMADT